MNKKERGIDTKYDIKRTLRYLALGTFIYTPPMHYWYTFMVPALTKRYLLNIIYRFGALSTKPTSKAMTVF